MKPQILERRTVWGGYLKIERLRVRLADGSQAIREVVSHGHAVAVLPYDAGRRCALVVELFRAPVIDATGQDRLLEACAGMIDDSETPEISARREAEEELGVRLGALELVGQVWSSPGVSTERVSLFLAPYEVADRVADGGGAPGEHELITVHERDLPSLSTDSDAGGIADAKLLTLVLALRLRRPELFG